MEVFLSVSVRLRGLPMLYAFQALDLKSWEGEEKAHAILQSDISLRGCSFFFFDVQTHPCSSKRNRGKASFGRQRRVRSARRLILGTSS